MMRVMFILLFVFSSLGHAAVPNEICQQRHCLAIVDAGSTGSRLHIYAYDLNDKNTPIQIDEIWSKKVKPGFASIEPKNVDAYLTNLFSQAPEQNLPLYFYATGGMRLISQPKQQLSYQSLNQWFSKQTQWELKDAKTITGKQEGIFGWLAVNYKLGTLQSSDKPMVSMMDMGGASVQIAIPVENAESINPNDLIQLDTYDRHVTLFVHSFLGLGQTEVSHHYLNAANCFPYDYPLPNESTGQGDAQTCQQDISKLINSVHEVNQLVEPVLMSNPNVYWYAMSGLSVLVKNKQFSFEEGQFTSQDMLQQADTEFCHQDWQTLRQQSQDNDYMYVNCLTSSYYYALLVSGYGLHPNQVVHFMPDEEEPDWTLGVVLGYSH